ncbi:MAG: PHP domain-containing protein [Bdellovibrionales bacterium]|nr:PHP domain-containing protein [Bdellovibrionales bacterium]
MSNKQVAVENEHPVSVAVKPTPVPQSDRMKQALELPNGARFYRCALQVNPFAYLGRHNHQTPYSTEQEYNKAMIQAFLDEGIEVIGVTDHYRAEDSKKLVEEARAAGIHAFNGFEAVTRDGVHFLCLFDPDKDDLLERFIGNCGVHNQDEESPLGNKYCPDLLSSAREWGAICIAAHVASDQGGLLKKLSGQTRMDVWRSADLMACALPGPVSAAPDSLRPILENKNSQHKRPRPIAVINASDVNGPEDLKKQGASCYIKMSQVSVEGFRQAFLDPSSRIRLLSDPQPEPHVEFLAMTWEGGFLDGTSVHFNENLNVLVGGRGTGKSTMIESMRYVLGLEPLGEDARNAHDGVVRHVLRSGTKISMLVRSHKPSERCYTIERSVPNPPVVKDDNGEVLTLKPRDVIPGVEVFGQHEISELTKSREKLTILLERFIDHDPNLTGRKTKIRLELEKSRRRIVDLERERAGHTERLAALPALEETQKRFKDAGLEDKLKEKSQVIREERVFTGVTERLDPLKALNAELLEALPIDTALISEKALDGLPNADILGEMRTVLDELSGELGKIGSSFGKALANTQKKLDGIKNQWDKRRQAIESTYEKLLRELQKSNVDGEEFIRLRKQIEELRPLKDRTEGLKRDLESNHAQRRKLLSEWEDIKASEYRELERAAKKVKKELDGRVRVEVIMAGNREPLETLLRERIGGNLASVLERLRQAEQLSLQDFAQRCREGKEALTKHYGFTSAQADKVSQASSELFMEIEELDLPATTKIELNTAGEGDAPQWRTLEQLSTGQKATAVLLLLLLESEAPLVVDQPEDDLDNRFITEGVVPIMRQEKRRRQFVFSTHNANIPVLGDAELILGLAASGEAGGDEGKARVAKEHMGSIDSAPVRELVEEILEGGKEAFEMRRTKYGF